jgi:hypothetical protein
MLASPTRSLFNRQLLAPQCRRNACKEALVLSVNRKPLLCAGLARLSINYVCCKWQLSCCGRVVSARARMNVTVFAPVSEGAASVRVLRKAAIKPSTPCS